MNQAIGLTLARIRGLYQPIVLGIVLGITAGCATQPQAETANLHSVATARSVTLPNAISRQLGRGIRQGIAAGTYTAESENALGTFFVGPGRAFFEKFPNGQANYFEGGFWLPRDEASAPLFFYKLWTNGQDPGGAVQSAAAASPTFTAATPLQAGIGAGIAGGFISAVAASEKGRIILLGVLEDAQFVKELNAVAGRQQAQ